MHGLVGKESNNNKLHIGYMIIFQMWFNELIQFALPRASRIFTNTIDNEEAGKQRNSVPRCQVELQDADEEVMELPSSTTKRGIYVRFLKDTLGIVRELEAKGRITGVRGAENHNVVPPIYPSWQSFNLYWEEAYPKLVIAKPRKDICDDCWRFANAFCFRKRNVGAEVDDGADSDKENQREQDNNKHVVNEAAQHFEKAKIQRCVQQKDQACKGNSLLLLLRAHCHLGA